MLRETLVERKLILKEKVGEDILKKIKKSAEKLGGEGYIAHIAKRGFTMPKITLLNHKNEEVDLYDELENKKTIISFYRGAWCPFCNLELAEYRKLLKDKKNINMIAISPELPSITEQTMVSENLPFKVLSDKDNKLAKKLNLCFHLPRFMEKVYDDFNVDLTMSQGNSNKNLPIPATIVGDGGTLAKFEYLIKLKTGRATPPTTYNFSCLARRTARILLCNTEKINNIYAIYMVGDNNMKKAIDTVLILAFIIAVMIHFYPFAMWNDFTLSLLRFISAFSIQLLLCRVVKNKVLRIVPTISAILFSCWSTWLFLTSSSWHSATFIDLVSHHLIFLIGCGSAWLIFLLGVKKRRT